MHSEPNIKIETLLCTVCGMAVAIVSDVETNKILSTVLHAMIGAVVSFFVSLLLKRVIEKMREWPRKVTSSPSTSSTDVPLERGNYQRAKVEAFEQN